MNIRMMPPVAAIYQTMAANGRTYSAAPGTVLDVPDFDASILSANGWIAIAPSGTTAQRPTGTIGLYPAVAGSRFYDVTIGKLIVHDGATWRSPVDGSAV